jgi:hypothetical protein
MQHHVTATPGRQRKSHRARYYLAGLDPITSRVREWLEVSTSEVRRLYGAEIDPAPQGPCILGIEPIKLFLKRLDLFAGAKERPSLKDFGKALDTAGTHVVLTWNIPPPALRQADLRPATQSHARHYYKRLGFKKAS